MIHQRCDYYLQSVLDLILNKYSYDYQYDIMIYLSASQVTALLAKPLQKLLKPAQSNAIS